MDTAVLPCACRILLPFHLNGSRSAGSSWWTDWSTRIFRNLSFNHRDQDQSLEEVKVVNGQIVMDLYVPVETL